MKNLDLETIHSRINKTISISSAYSKNIYMKNIIKYCRLRPYSIFDNDITKKYKLETHWIDEFGNSLYLEKNNSNIVFNDVKQNVISSDLFYGLDIKNTIDISSYAFVSHSTLTKNIQTTCLIGKDRYLRCFNNLKSEKISPLYLGIENLCMIFENYGIKRNKKLNIINDELKLSDKEDMLDLYLLPIESEEEKETIKKLLGV